MKTNLIKILALGAVVVSLGACQKKKAKVVEINELLEINADSKKWELEGQLVKVEHLVLQGFYGNTYIGGGAIGDYVTDLRGVEIQVKKAPKFERNFGYGADITAEGRVVDVNGRLTLQEAKITVNSERPEDGKYKEGEGGLPIYSCPPSATSRSTLDNYLSGRIYSGILVEGVYQLASVPAAIDASSPASSFSVVFPGEDLDLTDAENLAPIVVNVPAGSELTPGAITAFNTYFAEKKAGDFSTICTTFQYDLEKNGGMGMVLESFWSQKGLEEVAKKDQPVIFSSWEEVMDNQGGYYDGGFVDLTKASEEEAALENPFSYLVDESYLDDPKSMWQEAYVSQIIKISDGDLKKCASSVVTVNIKPSKMEAYLDAVEAKLKAASYALDESMAENGVYLFTFSDAEVVKKEVVVMLNNESQVEYQYIAPRAALDYATFAEFKEGFEGLASAKMSALTETSYTHTSALVDFSEGKKPSNINLSWMYEALFDGLKAYGMALPYYSVTYDFADKAAAAAALTDYEAKLAAAGFVERKLALSKLGSFPDMTGFFNSTSKEFIFIDQDYDSTAHDYTNQLYANLFVANDAAIAALVEVLPASDAELLSRVTSFYSYLATTYAAAGFGTTTGLPASFNIGATLHSNHWDVALTSESLSEYAISQITIEIKYDGEVTNDALATYISGLSGFAPKYHMAFETNGYWNATTGEFLVFDNYDNVLEITILIHGAACPFLSYIVDPA